MNEHDFRLEAERILTFWSKMIDPKFGGFIGEINFDQQKQPHAVKGGVMTSRYLWTYARAFALSKDQCWRRCADQAFDFLEQHLWDQADGGIYWLVDYQGKPIDPIKHLYAQAFAIYGLSEYYLATGNSKALALAKQTFNLIIDHAATQDMLGYHEEFTKTWQQKASSHVAPPQPNLAFTTNTHLHLLEAFTNLYRCQHDAAVKSAVTSLLALFRDVIIANQGFCYQEFTSDWHPIDDHISFGHDIETSWLLAEALTTIGSNDAQLSQQVRHLAQNVARFGRDQKTGALNDSLRGGTLDSTKIWWIQAEAVTGFYHQYSLSTDQRYLMAANETWDYIKKWLIDPRPHSEWFAYRTATNQLRRDKTEKIAAIGDQWKGPYHTARMCFEMSKKIRLFQSDSHTNLV
ncbi:AGE family epimerase/isomerase [Lapidilactobacillus luobeiensis]|uniref:AGE family epimerase/isomerase n=1 Tax=Lapidilactobacillus luobeiensis TaxID=2950371 RepID=UPI0021C39175|nr:AGE family epimerase/isomerase [Lapidilactobacillus luobeiensis]